MRPSIAVSKEPLLRNDESNSDEVVAVPSQQPSSSQQTLQRRPPPVVSLPPGVQRRVSSFHPSSSSSPHSPLSPRSLGPNVPSSVTHGSAGGGRLYSSPTPPSSYPYEYKLGWKWIVAFYCFACGAFSLSYFMHESTFFFATSIPVYLLTTVIAAFGLHLHSQTYLRPGLIAHTVYFACWCFFVLATDLDYYNKCSQLMDLSLRVLQNARTFDCEVDGVKNIIQWNVLALSGIALQFGFVCVLYTVYTRLKGLVTQAPEDVGLSICSYIVAGLASVAVVVMVLLISFAPADYTLEGTCPVNNGLVSYPSPPNPLLFVTQPHNNDLGCCTHIDNGTCCHQSICRYKPFYSNSLQDNRSPVCHDYLGLLSCAPCRANAAVFAYEGYDGMNVCYAFCQNVYEACNIGSATGNPQDAITWCTNQLRVSVIQNTTSEPCFNHATYHRHHSHHLLLLLLFSAIMLIWMDG